MKAASRGYLAKLCGTLGLACATVPCVAGATDDARQLVLRDGVRQSIITMVNAVDSKQWSTVRAQFADTVFVDYSSMTGQPGGDVKATELVEGWQQLLGQVDSHHLLSNFEVTVEGNRAQALSHVYASHTSEGVEYWDVFGRYRHTLSHIQGQWKVTGLTFTAQGQKGNLTFFQDVAAQQNAAADSAEQEKTVTVNKVEFLSEGEKVVGNLYLPANYDADKDYPAVIVSGSWTTVKEQMSGLYARRLAEQGYVALAFDPRNFGESEGKVRFYENPTQKVEDIRSAVSYLQQRSDVNAGRVGALGICAGSMYTLMAAAEDERIRSVVTVASWLHDAEAVKLFYGGADGVQSRISAARDAKTLFAETGQIKYIPSISTTDASAAMYGEYDYYLNPARGAVPQWSDDKFAVMSWEDWLTLNPMPSAAHLNAPTLMIHSEGAVLPDYTRAYFDQIATDDKKLFWVETELPSPFHQFSFYDQPAEVDLSVDQATRWFDSKL